ncbi:MAG: SufE family protein [Candidatus Thalassarchaeaceae archaeon]|jgi:cysteine desulfuration protein SufE|nr:cysteine desulfuration protein SufE [Euryarchaeota archaeon]MDP6871675.1 SufE family protein [Candidatus Thalassarchaeaceae archaeon]
MPDDSEWSEEISEIVDRFQSCFDDMERLELLFEYAEKHPSNLPMEMWNDENMVHGCQSRAHVVCSLNGEGGFMAEGGADAQIVQGLMAITAIAVNGQPPEKVAEHDPSYIEGMGLSRILTPSRANGFMNMVSKVKKEASSLM